MKYPNKHAENTQKSYCEKSIKTRRPAGFLLTDFYGRLYLLQQVNFFETGELQYGEKQE
jgi:hypothetical protein